MSVTQQYLTVGTSQAIKAEDAEYAKPLFKKDGFTDYVILCLQVHGLILLANSLKCGLSLSVSSTDIVNLLILDIKTQRCSPKSVSKYFKALSTP